jgi:hypothetical protein
MSPVKTTTQKKFSTLFKLLSMLKPLGFVLATALNNLLENTATHVFSSLRIRLGRSL